MGFWNNVEQERVFQGISRKDLAYKANISYASISLGLERNSMPGADTALRVSKVLRVPLEDLLKEDQCSIRQETPLQAQKPQANSDSRQIMQTAVSALRKMPYEIRSPIIEMILKIGKEEIRIV